MAPQKSLGCNNAPPVGGEKASSDSEAKELRPPAQSPYRAAVIAFGYTLNALDVGHKRRGEQLGEHNDVRVTLHIIESLGRRDNVILDRRIDNVKRYTTYFHSAEKFSGTMPWNWL